MRSSPETAEGGLKAHSVQDCFASVVLARISGLESAKTRSVLVKMCMRAWNVGCVGTPEAIDAELDLLKCQAMQLQGPSRTAFLYELGNIVRMRKELFPWINQRIEAAELVGEGRAQSLMVQIRGRSWVTPISIDPPVETLPQFEQTLASLMDTTDSMLPLLRGGKVLGTDCLTDIDLTKLAGVYAVQKANLAGYRGMLLRLAKTELSESSRSTVERCIDHIRRIEIATVAVLDLVLQTMYPQEATVN